MFSYKKESVQPIFHYIIYASVKLGCSKGRYIVTKEMGP